MHINILLSQHLKRLNKLLDVKACIKSHCPFAWLYAQRVKLKSSFEPTYLLSIFFYLKGFLYKKITLSNQTLFFFFSSFFFSIFSNSEVVNLIFFNLHAQCYSSFLSFSSCINKHSTCPVLNIFNLGRWWGILGVLYYIPFLYYAALSLSILCHLWRIKKACSRVGEVLSIVSLFQLLVPLSETAISNMILYSFVGLTQFYYQAPNWLIPKFHNGDLIWVNHTRSCASKPLILKQRP